MRQQALLTFLEYMVYIRGMKELTNTDIEFISLVYEAGFANPFSKERDELDKRISGKNGNRLEVLEKALAKIEQTIARLDSESINCIGDFPTSQQKIAESLYLFDVFHKFIGRFDQLIVRQEQQGEEPVQVDFGDEAISTLMERGLDAKKSVWYFSIFYQLRRAFYFIDRLKGQSECMRQLRVSLWNNIFTHSTMQYEQFMWDRMEDFSILLLGPTGAGKGAAAAAIGKSGFTPYSERKRYFKTSFTKLLLTANISSFSDSLIESELFGHKKGSFTGAISDYTGIFAQCEKHGSVFLDEIGEVGTRIQIKLLNVLQDRIFMPVASNQRQRFSGRIIAATNQPIESLKSADCLREDFYYRLCSDIITVPSLYERISQCPEELETLVRHAVEKITGEESEKLTRQVMAAIKKLPSGYDWPGNVRELEQCVRAVMIKADYKPIKTKPKDITEQLNNEEITASALLARYCTKLYEKHNSFEKVARIAGLDRRTVKKYIEAN